MRWLFLLLLVANIAYVGWELTHEPVADPATAAVMPDAPRIVLLSELHGGSTPPAMSQSDTESAPAQRESTGMPSSTAGSGVGTADGEPVAAVGQARVETPVDPADEQADQRDATGSDRQPGEDRCYTLGPFRELDELSAFTRAIKSHVVDTSFRSRDEKEQSMFWVLLESTGSMDQARQLGNELVSREIRDYFIITSGAHKYGISLGHFREQERAYRHAKRIRKLGFEPVVEPVFRTYTIYWLDYRMKAGEAIPPRVFDESLPASVNRLDRPCQP